MKKFFSELLSYLGKIEGKIEIKSRFSTNEVNEILASARAENVPFMNTLMNINKLSAFDISLILSGNKLNLDKIEVIKKAVSLYSDEEFKAQGQTFSDFISKVCANLETLDMGNIDYFKEIAALRAEIYDFTNLLKKPMKNSHKQASYQFAFERVLVD